MELFLIRHTKVNAPDGICYGISDVSLANTFPIEAINIQDQLKDYSFDAVWCSPLMRCSKLANFLFPNQVINYDSRLKELNFGDWENMAWDDIYQKLEGKLWMDNFINQACPNGESFNDQITRVNNFFKDKLAETKLNKVVIITHGGVIRAFNSMFGIKETSEAFTYKVDYGSITQIKINE